MFLYHDMQISSGGTLRFKFQNIDNKHLWSVELREDPSWGNVKCLYKKDITQDGPLNSILYFRTYDMTFELPHVVTEKQEIAYYDNLEYAINCAMSILNKNK